MKTSTYGYSAHEKSPMKYAMLAVFLAFAAVNSELSAQQVDFAGLLRKIVPEADRFSQVSQTVTYKAQSLTLAIFPAYKSNEQIGVVFYSAPNGYSGRLHTLTSLDMKGTVRRVSVFSHTETPAYVGPLNDGRFLRQFEGVSLTDKLSFLIGRKAESRGEIQAITGATDTSKPIALAVSEARRLFVEIYGT
ncbi:MAG: FMN-binding protein [Spirochaetota bacterium]